MHSINKLYAITLVLVAVIAANIAHADPTGVAIKEFAGISDSLIKQYAVADSREPLLSGQQTLALLRSKVKYVFVLYQENRSFDSYFGTFPGALGLYSQPASQTRGFYQVVINTDGTHASVRPFRIGPAQYAADTDDVDHSHAGIVAKMDIYKGVPLLDKFVIAEERKHSPTGNPSLQAKQYGELTMAYEDGDTVPFLWRFANRFTLFDHIFQEMDGPSTPGNLSIIGAQSGATQLMLHPDEAYRGDGSSGGGLPVSNDSRPFWGSGQPSDNSGMPMSPKDKTSVSFQENLTFSTLPLTLAGKSIGDITKSDTKPGVDLKDVAEDIGDIQGSGKQAVAWGWYQEGYDKEPTDTGDDEGPLDAAGNHASYLAHHNGPQYFGYISNNSQMRSHLHGLQDFFDDVKNGGLPKEGGLFYVKGGFRNLLSLKPADPDPAVQAAFLGDDDHPVYSDSQISEAEIATEVNSIAASKYWKSCAIIITWDDSEGDFDSVPPPIRQFGPDGSPTADGPRVPLILISPWAKAHSIPHDPGDHASVVKFVDHLFNVKPLAQLPDELEARKIGESKGLKNQGPFDSLTPDICDLTSAFDPARLAGTAPPLPAWYAETPENLIKVLPGISGYGWRQVGVVPTDYAKHIKNMVPADFNPRPGTNPSKASTP